MVINEDFKEFIKLLNANQIKYLVVMSYTVAFHGYPRIINEKYVTDGDRSPLKDYNLKELNTKITGAVDNDKKIKKYTRVSKEQTRERNLAFDAVMENMRAMGALLKAKYRDNPKELGKWGFTVTGE